MVDAAIIEGAVEGLEEEEKYDIRTILTSIATTWKHPCVITKYGIRHQTIGTFTSSSFLLDRHKTILSLVVLLQKLRFRPMRLIKPTNK